MPTRTSATAASAGSAVRATVTVVAGFHGRASRAVADRLLADDPTSTLVHHDLTNLATGSVERTVRTRDRLVERERITLAHGCAACTVREDVLPTLVRLGRTDPSRGIVLLLPEIIEPAMLAGACASCLVDGEPITSWLRFDSYITVTDSTCLLSDLESTDDLRDRGIQAAAEDNRGVAEVVARQVEFADAVVSWEPANQHPHDRLRHRQLLHRLAPWARHHHVESASRFDPGTLQGTAGHQSELPEPVARGLEGYQLGVHEPVGDWGVHAVLFRARRPLHPQRLHSALETFAGQVLRARGHLWLATRPELVLGIEAAGARVSLGSLGRWLTSVDPARWDDASQMRQLAAAVDWDPYYGDRGNHIAFVAADIDAVALHHRLNACLLTDAELAAGEQRWADLPDPFAPYFLDEEQQ